MIITAAVRGLLKQVLVNSREYDASTMRITRDGVVTAKKDADKTFRGNDDTRYDVGYAIQIVQDGMIREGW